jgi:short-subunit dehydrogenase
LGELVASVDSQEVLTNHFHSGDSLIRNKAIVVTGSTGSLGRVICQRMLAGNNSLTLLGRDYDKLEMLKRDLLLDFPRSSIVTAQLDFLHFASVIEYFKNIKKPSCDLLINNAGIRLDNSFLTENGIEVHTQVNFLAPHYLATKFAEINPRLSVINIGSSAALRVHTRKTNLFETMNHRNFRGVYALSKLALLVSTKHLNEGNADFNLMALDPGNVKSPMTLGSHSPTMLKIAARYLFKEPTEAYDKVSSFFSIDSVQMNQGKFMGYNGENEWTMRYDYPLLQEQVIEFLGDFDA